MSDQLPTMRHDQLPEHVEGVFDDYEAALVGYVERDGIAIPVYDAERCVELLMERNGWSYDDATEWFSYNESAWFGPGTPLYLYRRCAGCGQLPSECICEEPDPDPANVIRFPKVPKPDEADAADGEDEEPELAAAA